MSFALHVPVRFDGITTDQPAQEVLAQADRGRGSVPSTGNWILYAQSAYQGPTEGDNDPDGERAAGAINGLSVAGKPASLIYFETIRDGADNSFETRDDETFLRNVMFAHEAVHQFGYLDVNNPTVLISVPDDGTTSDGTAGIMESRSRFRFPYLTAPQLRIIRKDRNPGDQNP